LLLGVRNLTVAAGAFHHFKDNIKADARCISYVGVKVVNNINYRGAELLVAEGVPVVEDHANLVLLHNDIDIESVL